LIGALEDADPVQPKDMPDLGFVLYPDRPEAEGLTMVESAISQLQTEGRVSKDGDCFRVLGEKTSG